MSDFVKELYFIKQVQKSFKEQFGRKLVVDIAATKDDFNYEYKCEEASSEDMEAYLINCAKEYGADLQKIRNKSCPAGSVEREVLCMFSRKVVESRWNKSRAALLVNRDRTQFRYYTQ